MNAAGWTIIVLLILLTGLYVAAEFAAVSARRSRLRRLAEDGNDLAARILPVLEDPATLDRYIAASQIGITLSSLILGAYGQATIAPRVAPLLERAGAWSVPLPNPPPQRRYVFLTILAVIIGELVPKSLALQNPDAHGALHRASDAVVAAVIQWSIAFLNGSGVLLLRLIGLPATGHRHVHSPQESNC